MNVFVFVHLNARGKLYKAKSNVKQKIKWRCKVSLVGTKSGSAKMW